MSAVSGTIPNFVNGVSQQPYALRLASQAEEQINGLSTIAEGLVKRPPTNHVARLRGRLATADSFIHTINRDSTERYFLVAGPGFLEVYGLDGSPKTVNFPNGKGYLTRGDLSAVTVADYTVLVNPGIVTAMADKVQTLMPPQGLVYVRQGVYSTRYSVTIDYTTVTFDTGSNGDDGAAATIQTDYIAGRLAAAIYAATSDFVAEQHGATLRIKRVDGGTFNLAVNDSYGATALVAFKDKLQQFTDLPAKAFQDTQVEITGTPSNAFDNFYVRFAVTSGYDGVWEEAARPGRKVALDPATMPHLLIREADGTFTFREAEWDECAAGSEVTVPEPSFVGQAIADVFFMHNRLGLVSGEQVVMSRSAGLFNFWRSTATALLDTDPIDLTTSHSKVSRLRHAVPFNEELLLFSDESQFVLSGGDVLTPRTASVVQSTEFAADIAVRPCGAGSYLYFSAARGTATSIREYYVDGQTRNKDADDVTAHVPHYIPPGCRQLIASNVENMLVARVDGAPNRLYIYKFFFQGQQQKAQSAWSRWDFEEDDDIRQAAFLDNSLYLVVQRPAGLFLDRIDLDIGIVSEDLPYAVLLDRRVSESAVRCTYQPSTNTTTVELPYDLQVTAPHLVVVGEGRSDMPPGFRPKILEATRDVVRVKGSLLGLKFRLGVPYTFRYELSTLVGRKATVGGGQVADTLGRLQVRRVAFNYADTGYFRVEVKPTAREPYTYTFTGRVTGSMGLRLGGYGIETGTFRVPVMARNTGVQITIINDSHLPCRFLTAEWEGQRVQRSLNIT